MRIAILLYDNLASLDAIGPYEVLAAIPGAEVTTVGERTGPVRTGYGSLGLVVDATLDELPNPDVLVVPGGSGARYDEMAGGAVGDWLRTADRTSTWTTSVCTGSLLVARTGLLAGRRATTHWLSLDRLAAWQAVPTAERVVFDGKYVTGAGVSAGIDMALALAGKIAGDHVAQSIQLGIEYDPQPPYQAGSPNTAPEAVVAEMRAEHEAWVASRK